MKVSLTEDQFHQYKQGRILSLRDFFSLKEESLLSSLKGGYDLWRQNPSLKKILSSKKLGSLIHDLTQERPLQLLFDRIVLEKEEIKLYETSFQGIIVGILLALDENLLTIFSSKKKLSIEKTCYLVAFGKPPVRYVYKERDPLTSHLKKMGYSYGDRLKDEDFPIVYH